MSKRFLTLAVLCLCGGAALAQSAGQEPSKRTPETSMQKSANPVGAVPYDVEDRYMGRKAEFLNMLTVSKLPEDFPVYDKQWSVKDYNEVVQAYLINHQDILKPKVKEKILLVQQSK
jgi:hypothetical protein